MRPGVVLLGAALAAGCGRDGPARTDLSGAVTFGGKPVPRGMIVFDPDRSAGNRGPQGSAEVSQGRYRTGGEFGPVAGPHVVRVDPWLTPPGPGEPAPPGGPPLTSPAYRGYEAKVVVPATGPAVLDIAIPGD